VKLGISAGNHTILSPELRDFRVTRSKTKQRSDSHQRYRTAVKIAKLRNEMMKKGQEGKTHGTEMY
jgi:hypothetical protein